MGTKVPWEPAGAAPYLGDLRRTAYVDSPYMRPFVGKIASLANDADLLRLISDHDLGLLVTEALPGVVRPPPGIASPLASVGNATLYVIAPSARFRIERIQRANTSTCAPGHWVRGTVKCRGSRALAAL